MVLLVLVLGLALVRRSDHYWPIVTWPVYSLIRPVFPPPTTALLEARVTTTSGQTRVFRSADLVEWSRHAIADPVLAGAVAEDQGAGRRAAARAHVVRLVALALGHAKLESIEIWRVEWSVEPLARPPLVREKPSAEVRLARFEPPR